MFWLYGCNGHFQPDCFRNPVLASCPNQRHWCVTFVAATYPLNIFQTLDPILDSVILTGNRNWELMHIHSCERLKNLQTFNQSENTGWHDGCSCFREGCIKAIIFLIFIVLKQIQTATVSGGHSLMQLWFEPKRQVNTTTTTRLPGRLTPHKKEL